MSRYGSPHLLFISWSLLPMMISSLLVFIIASGCSSNSEASPVRSENLSKNVFTNLTLSFAQAVRFELSSAVSQGELRGIKLGSAGSKVGNAIGAASSYGVGQLEFMRISIGVSAAKAKTSEAVSKVIHSHLGRRWHRGGFKRFKRDDVNAATSLNEVTGPGVKSVMGSTAISAGPVATSISLGSILLAARNSFTAVNAGALAAHAGNTDASNSFSNSNIGGDTGHATRSMRINEAENGGDDIGVKDEGEEEGDEGLSNDDDEKESADIEKAENDDEK